MTVSEIAAEVLSVQDVLAGEMADAAEDGAAAAAEAEDEPVEHAA
jgi:hypothetical protein